MSAQSKGYSSGAVVDGFPNQRAEYGKSCLVVAGVLFASSLLAGVILAWRFPQLGLSGMSEHAADLFNGPGGLGRLWSLLSAGMTALMALGLLVGALVLAIVGFQSSRPRIRGVQPSPQLANFRLPEWSFNQATSGVARHSGGTASRLALATDKPYSGVNALVHALRNPEEFRSVSSGLVRVPGWFGDLREQTARLSPEIKYRVAIPTASWITQQSVLGVVVLLLGAGAIAVLTVQPASSMAAAALQVLAPLGALASVVAGVIVAYMVLRRLLPEQTTTDRTTHDTQRIFGQLDPALIDPVITDTARLMERDNVPNVIHRLNATDFARLRINETQAFTRGCVVEQARRLQAPAHVRDGLIALTGGLIASSIGGVVLVVAAAFPAGTWAGVMMLPIGVLLPLAVGGRLRSVGRSLMDLWRFESLVLCVYGEGVTSQTNIRTGSALQTMASEGSVVQCTFHVQYYAARMISESIGLQNPRALVGFTDEDVREEVVAPMMSRLPAKFPREAEQALPSMSTTESAKLIAVNVAIDKATRFDKPLSMQLEGAPPTLLIGAGAAPPGYSEAAAPAAPPANPPPAVADPEVVVLGQRARLLVEQCRALAHKRAPDRVALIESKLDFAEALSSRGLGVEARAAYQEVVQLSGTTIAESV